MDRPIRTNNFDQIFSEEIYLPLTQITAQCYNLFVPRRILHLADGLSGVRMYRGIRGGHNENT